MKLPVKLWSIIQQKRLKENKTKCQSPPQKTSRDFNLTQYSIQHPLAEVVLGREDMLNTVV